VDDWAAQVDDWAAPDDDTRGRASFEYVTDDDAPLRVAAHR